MKIAVDISLIPELTNTPHIPAGDLEIICKTISDYGYDGIELFSRNAQDISISEIRKIIEANSLNVCAIGTGAGKVLYGLTLTNPDKEIRKRAISYISEFIKVAGELNALVIIGSMQGSVDNTIGKEQTIEWLIESLYELALIANDYNVTLVLEPLNRYESNLVNNLSQGVGVIKKIGCNNIKLLADLFHMNIEESSMEQAIIKSGAYIGHVHFADSNRLFPGLGHSNFKKMFKALKQIHYEGYISIEALVTNTQIDLQYAMKVYSASAN